MGTSLAHFRLTFPFSFLLKRGDWIGLDWDLLDWDQEFFWCSLHRLAANATETTVTVDENGTVGTLQQRNLNLSCNLNLSHRSMVHNYQLLFSAVSD